jgi:hydrogenase maturation protease
VPGPVLVGGVGQLYQGDLDVGRRAAVLLAAQDLGPGVLVEDLHYGAVAVVHRLAELRPAALVLVGAERRGRPPGTLERREVPALDLPPEELQRAVHDAITGYVTIDLLVEVAWALGNLPALTVTIEVEPGRVGPSEVLSPEVEALLPEVVRLAAEEARRAAGHVRG